MAENGNGEGPVGGSGPEPEYGGTMEHASNIPLGGADTGEMRGEGQIIDLGENPMYDDTDPIFQFRSGALGLTPDMTKALIYAVVGYYLYTRWVQ